MAGTRLQRLEFMKALSRTSTRFKFDSPWVGFLVIFNTFELDVGLEAAEFRIDSLRSLEVCHAGAFNSLSSVSCARGLVVRLPSSFSPYSHAGGLSHAAPSFCIYVDRTFGGDCDYCNPDWAAAPGRSEDPSGRARSQSMNNLKQLGLASAQPSRRPRLPPGQRDGRGTSA